MIIERVSFKADQPKLICDVIYVHGFEMKFTKQRISLKKPTKFIQYFQEYAPTLHYYIRVKFE